LHEQQGLSPLGTLAGPSSEEEEEEESDGGAPREVESPTPVTTGRRAAVELAPAAGVEAPAAGVPAEKPASATEALASAIAASVGATAAPPSPRGRGSRASLT
jgi:hypothetical protein